MEAVALKRVRPYSLWCYLAHTGSRCTLQSWHLFYQATIVTLTMIPAVFMFIDTAISNLKGTIRLNKKYLLSFT